MLVSGQSVTPEARVYKRQTKRVLLKREGRNLARVLLDAALMRPELLTCLH